MVGGGVDGDDEAEAEAEADRGVVGVGCAAWGASGWGGCRVEEGRKRRCSLRWWAGLLLRLDAAYRGRGGGSSGRFVAIAPVSGPSVLSVLDSLV